jgi:asparagine synthase (glutamine-hydrolysing)
MRRTMSFEALVLTGHQRRRLYGLPLQDESAGDDHTVRTYRELFDESCASARLPENQVQALIMRTWLPGNGLLALDKVTMAYGLEARVPYFDRRFIDDVLALPWQARLEAGKALLRRAVAEEVPARWRLRRKQPFETPLLRWLDHDLGEHVRSVLLDHGARIRALFDMGRVETILRRHARRTAEHAELVFRLLVLELWWREVLDR